MKQEIKNNLKLILGVILTLFLIFLAADIIKDLLIFIFKDSLNKIIFQIIHFMLIFMFITLLFKTKTIKNLEKQIIFKMAKTK